jgi:hypothetical protein
MYKGRIQGQFYFSLVFTPRKRKGINRINFGVGFGVMRPPEHVWLVFFLLLCVACCVSCVSGCWLSSAAGPGTWRGWRPRPQSDNCLCREWNFKVFFLFFHIWCFVLREFGINGNAMRFASAQVNLDNFCGRGRRELPIWAQMIIISRACFQIPTLPANRDCSSQ